LMLAYSSIITLTGITAWWILRALGWRHAIGVALGAILATVADAIIGHFWIVQDTAYPTVRYLNWVIYFASQAMIQPLALAMALKPQVTAS